MSNLKIKNTNAEINLLNTIPVIQQQDIINKQASSYEIVYSIDNSFSVVYCESSLIVLNNKNNIVYKQFIKKNEKLISVKTYCRKICLYIISKETNYISIIDYQNFTDHKEFMFNERVVDYYYFDQYYCESGFSSNGSHSNNGLVSDGRIRILLLTENYTFKYIVDFQIKSSLRLGASEVDLSNVSYRMEFEPLNGFYYVISSKGEILFINIENYFSDNESISFSSHDNLNINNIKDFLDNNNDDYSSSNLNFDLKSNKDNNDNNDNSSISNNNNNNNNNQSKRLINSDIKISNNLLNPLNNNIVKLKLIRKSTLLINNNNISFIIILIQKQKKNYLWYLKADKSTKLTHQRILELKDLDEVLDIYTLDHTEVNYIYYFGINSNNKQFEIKRSNIKNDLYLGNIEYDNSKTLGSIYAYDYYQANLVKLWNLVLGDMLVTKIMINFFIKEDSSLIAGFSINDFEIKDLNDNKLLSLAYNEKDVRDGVGYCDYSNAGEYNNNYNYNDNNRHVLFGKLVLSKGDNGEFILSREFDNSVNTAMNNVSSLRLEDQQVIGNTTNNNNSYNQQLHMTQCNHVLDDNSIINKQKEIRERELITKRDFYKSLVSETLVINYEEDFLSEYLNKNQSSNETLKESNINYQIIYYILSYSYYNKLKLKELLNTNITKYQLRSMISSNEIFNTIEIFYKALKGVITYNSSNKSNVNALLAIIEIIKTLITRIETPYQQINHLEKELQLEEKNRLADYLKQVECIYILVTIGININEVENDYEDKINEDVNKEEEEQSVLSNDSRSNNNINNNVSNNVNNNNKNKNSEAYIKLINEVYDKNDFTIIKVLLEKAFQTIHEIDDNQRVDISSANNNNTNLIFKINKNLFKSILLSKERSSISILEIFFMYSLYIFKVSLINSINIMIKENKINNNSNNNNKIFNSNDLLKLIANLKVPSKYFKNLIYYKEKYMKFCSTVYKLSFINNNNSNGINNNSNVNNIVSSSNQFLRVEFFFIINFIKTNFAPDTSKLCLMKLFENLVSEKRFLEASVVLSNINFYSNNNNSSDISFYSQLESINYHLVLYEASNKLSNAHILVANFLQSIDYDVINNSNNNNSNGYNSTVKSAFISFIKQYFKLVVKNKQYNEFINCMSYEIKVRLSEFINSNKNVFEEKYFNLDEVNIDGLNKMKLVLLGLSNNNSRSNRADDLCQESNYKIESELVVIKK